MSKKSLSTVEALGKAQGEIRRLAPFETWVRLQGRHAIFCTAPMMDNCTCGLRSLMETRKPK